MVVMVRGGGGENQRGVVIDECSLTDEKMILF